MIAFVFIELVLALLWPAAIPRLFTPVIPFLIIPIAMGIDLYFSEKPAGAWGARWEKTGLVGLLLIFVIAQYLLKLQFLVVLKIYFVLVVFVQIINIWAIHMRREKLFYITLIASLFVWSFSTIFLHKDIFKAVVHANEYVIENLSGTVVYNDVSSVSDWYLNQRNSSDNITGIYQNMDSKVGREYGALLEKGADYLMITNEVYEGNKYSQVRNFERFIEDIYYKG